MEEELLDAANAQLDAIRFYANRMFMFVEEKKANLHNPTETEISDLDYIRQKLAQAMDLWEANIGTN